MRSGDSEPIVALHGATKTYGKIAAVDSVDLAIHSGEFVTLLGPSGCGKTTTLRLIGGFEFPDKGSIKIAGEDMSLRPPYRRPVNTVFQDYALFPHMTVAENIGYGLSVRGSSISRTDRARSVSEALAVVGLSKIGGQRPGELSGGQRQRVALARAIVRKPRVLLLDEPLSALDVKLREGMQIELKRLHRELGITFLMVTHDQGEALALSDRIVLMDRGRIVQIGSPTELYDVPATPYVADFIGASNLLEARLITQDESYDELSCAGGFVLRRLRRPGDQAFSKGARVIAGIRPERLHWEVFPGANAFSARVVACLFQGGRSRVELSIGSNHKPLFADVTRAAAERSGTFQSGADMTCYVAPSDIMLFETEIRLEQAAS